MKKPHEWVGKTNEFFWIGLFETMSSCKLFATDSVSLECSFITYQENITFFEIAGCFGIPFVVANRYTCRNHFWGNYDYATSGFTGCDCRTDLRCNVKQRFQLRHLLFWQFGKIVGLTKKLFDYILSRGVDVELSVNQDFAIDHTNHNSPIVSIDATLRCFLSGDDSFVIRVVPDDIFEVTEVFYKT